MKSTSLSLFVSFVVRRASLIVRRLSLFVRVLSIVVVRRRNP